MKLLNWFDNRKAYITSFILFKFSLDFSYVYFISKFYSYSGYVLDVTPIKYIESFLINILLIVLYPKKLKKPSDYLNFTLLAFFLTPLLSYYALANESRYFLYLAVITSLLVYIFSQGKKFNIPTLQGGATIGISISILLLTVVTAWLVISTGMSNFNLDFRSVYDFRLDINEHTYVGPMAYLIPWLTKVVGSALIGYCYYSKKWLSLIVLVVLHVVWFGLTSHKSIAFYPLLVIVVWFWFTNRTYFTPIFIGCFLIISVATIYSLITGEYIYAAMASQRSFFTISRNTFDYFDFFSNHEFVYWSNSLTSGLLDYPYYTSPQKLIGHWQGTESFVNNSFIAMGYMHASYFGLVLYGVLVGLIFRVFNSFCLDRYTCLLVLSCIVVPSRELTLSSDLPTALLTHGILVAMILAFLLRPATSARFKGDDIGQIK